MDAITLLTQRRSVPRLSSPAPSGDALNVILDAGLRAPDHGALTPWEFIVAEGDGLDKLSAILKRAAESDGASDGIIEKATNGPFRAPMVITVIARTKQHDKVPLVEQYISAGCAAQAMQMAAVAQGFQGFWRTGNWAYHTEVRAALNVEGDDAIVGFLYLGSAENTQSSIPKRSRDKFVTYL
ncbi:NAD(P)H nitroreductase [Veronia nyctiphanis]|uniref:Putative NAD(P)H nitroreductase n=1 Tax=Veronia nyctiphanis TaxID=1278244 RepID=A0A4Q0YR81_9GAMM|nr:NAD(P)H nitroreductase [Veronia nyctiphanis]RXJ73602.1 NAD(P)H nitroreductase [Veronia nyctiphanis]